MDRMGVSRLLIRFTMGTVTESKFVVPVCAANAVVTINIIITKAAKSTETILRIFSFFMTVSSFYVFDISIYLFSKKCIKAMAFGKFTPHCNRASTDKKTKGEIK
jgi:ABC-type proline/glycine betaine transport system permease subunit